MKPIPVSASMIMKILSKSIRIGWDAGVSLVAFMIVWGLIKLVYRVDKAIEQESSMPARQKTSQSVVVHVMTFVSRNGMTGMLAELDIEPSMM
jgi:hypothetical protein